MAVTITEQTKPTAAAACSESDHKGRDGNSHRKI